MIKQDNRPHSETFETRLGVLNDLLHEDQSPEKEKAPPVPVVPPKRDKLIFISVNGNNNVVSAEKSQYTGRPHGKKAFFAIATCLCLLFF